MPPALTNPFLRDALAVVREHAPLAFFVRIERGFREIEDDLAQIEEARATVTASTRTQKEKR